MLRISHKLCVSVRLVENLILFKCLFVKRPDALLVSTQLVFIVAPFLKFLRKIPYMYWIMDLNPDQAIAAGALRKDSLSAKLYNVLQCLVLSNADKVVSLDLSLIHI